MQLAILVMYKYIYLGVLVRQGRGKHYVRDSLAWVF